MEKTVERVRAILHQYLDEIRVDDRSPDSEPIRVLLDEGSVRRDTYSWQATVRSSRMPRRWSYLYEEIGIVTEELLAKAGLNVFFTVDDAVCSVSLRVAASTGTKIVSRRPVSGFERTVSKSGIVAGNRRRRRHLSCRL